VYETRLTPYDAFAVGHLIPGPLAEIVTAVDDDADGADGRFTILDPHSALSWQFDARFTPNDRVAIGDVLAQDPSGEIVVAIDEDDRVYVYDYAGFPLTNFGARFTAHDCLATGDVSGGEEEEIVVAVAGDDQVHIYDAWGNGVAFDVDEFDFDGACSLGKKCNNADALAVGNVLGDAYAEIVLLDHQGDESALYVYDAAGTLLITTRVRYTRYDAMAVGDVLGDAREEILLAIDEDHSIHIYDAVLGRLKTQYVHKMTPVDGLAAADVAGGPRDDILLAIDDDDRLYVFGEGCGE
jgi:hypothetical protein